MSARLDEVLRRTLTTLTAPAGYGKSVAAAQWCARQSLPVTWVDLTGMGDDADGLRARVIAGVCDATGVDVDVALQVLVSGEPPTALAEAPAAIVVFDGVPAWPVDHTKELIDVLTRWHGCDLHVLAIGRCPPPAGLASLQMRGVVTHLTTADLQLDGGHVAAIVEAYSGRPIDEEVARELAVRFDGWVAGAALVGISRPSSGAMAADQLLDAAWNAIEGYLTAEVIDRVPDELRRFLLLTSCVDELPVALCDRLTGEGDSETKLRFLTLMGVPVARGTPDGGTHRATSYRYQNQLRAVLDDRFRREDAAGRAAALRMAADWFTEHQRPFDAAECLIRLGAWEDVVGVLVLYGKSILERDESDRLAELVVRAPPWLFRDHTGLAVAGAGSLVTAGRVAAANELLSLYYVHMPPAQRMIAELVRSGTYAWLDDMTMPYMAAESALALAEELGDDRTYDDLYNPSTTDMYRVLAHSSAIAACGLAGWWSKGRSHLVDIHPATVAALPHVQALHVRGRRAMYLMLAGDLAGGRPEAEMALRIASEAGLTRHRSAAEAHLSMGEGLRLTAGFDRAAEHLDLAMEAAVLNDRHNIVVAVTASRAHLFVDAGEPDSALELLERYRRETRHLAPQTLAGLLDAAEARALATRGDFFTSLAVLDGAPSTSATAAVEVAVSVAVGDLKRARGCLHRWPSEPTPASTVRRSLAAAQIDDALGSRRDAVRSLRAGLVVAATYGLVQPVAECGPPMGRLLRLVHPKGEDSRLAEIVRRAESLIASGGAMAPRFTERERVVLAHLDRGLSLPAVAREMVVSVNTVKTYVKSIYRKLGARSRAEALAAWRGTAPSRDLR